MKLVYAFTRRQREARTLELKNCPDGRNITALSLILLSKSLPFPRLGGRGFTLSGALRCLCDWQSINNFGFGWLKWLSILYLSKSNCFMTKTIFLEQFGYFHTGDESSGANRPRANCLTFIEMNSAPFSSKWVHLVIIPRHDRHCN